MDVVEVVRGDSPVVLGLPHTGTDVPDDCLERLNKRGRTLADTDWHVHSLYAGLLNGASSVRTLIHRYVIDVNRDTDGASLYPGQNTTGLCPVTDFDGVPIYLPGHEPDKDETARRCAEFHAPYHQALTNELARVRAIHGFAILYDCHSIRSRLSFLFDGVLPDFNIGTNDGQSCAPQMEKAVAEICAGAQGFSQVLNGRFKGGWTTRHYGRPSQDVHAIQMELAQSTYLVAEQAPWRIDAAKADRLRPHLKTILTTLAEWRPA